jgi:hypothetical protein
MKKIPQEMADHERSPFFLEMRLSKKRWRTLAEGCCKMPGFRRRLAADENRTLRFWNGIAFWDLDSLLSPIPRDPNDRRDFVARTRAHHRHGSVGRSRQQRRQKPGDWPLVHVDLQYIDVALSDGLFQPARRQRPVRR